MAPVPRLRASQLRRFRACQVVLGRTVVLSDEVCADILMFGVRGRDVSPRSGNGRLDDILVSEVMTINGRRRLTVPLSNLPFGNVEHCTSPRRIQPLVRVREPKIRLSLAQVDVGLVNVRISITDPAKLELRRVTNLLPNAMRRIYDAPHALLPANRHHLLPREEHAWHRRNRVNYCHDLVFACR